MDERSYSETAAKHLDAVRTQVVLLQNPSPLIVMLGTVFALAVVYVMFLMFIAPTPSGIWVDSKNNKYAISSGRLLGGIKISQIDCDGVSTPIKAGKKHGSMLTVAGLDAGSAGLNAADQIHGAWLETQIIWIDGKGSIQVWNRENVVE